uniref:Mediator of RNA polymerase II transcription subunit 15 n=1 Tax=Culicoides sonorensis TaxID=179676 RepID=A0A336LVV1_CULSO
MSGEQENSWRTPNFRQSVVNKINEAVVQSGMTSAKNSIDMENHVYQKSRTKDEYLSYVARLILHVREMNKAKGSGIQNHPPQIHQNQQGLQQQQGPGQQQQQQGGIQPDQNLGQQMPNQQQSAQQQQQQQNQQPGGMPDPINALQNLACQGTGRAGPGGPHPTMGQQNMMGNQQQQPPSNLLQTLTQQRPMQGMNPMGGIQQQRPMMPGQMSGGNMTMNMQQQQQLMQQQAQQNQMMGQGPMNPMVGPNQMPNQMMGNPQQNQMQMNQMAGMQMNQGQGNPMGPGIRPQIPPGMNPAQAQAMMQQQQMQQQQQAMGGPQGPINTGMMMNSGMARTPGVPSPINSMSQQGMIPSPALIANSPNPQIQMMNRPQIIAQSPSQPLNTPMRPGETAPSPLNAHDDQLYREKYRQLTKYIEPLKRMIARMGNDDGDRLHKLKKLLEILSNPNSRIPLDTLLKCETALENQLGTFKEHTINNPLLEAVSANMQNPLANHTMQRTFKPCTDSLFGSDIKTIPLPSRNKRFKKNDDDVEKSGPEISHILQGEIARLDSKFKITLDPSAGAGSKSVKLICWLDDKNLPCVPPINVTIPRDYPKSSPECLIEPEYEGTEFLQSVQEALTARIVKLPKFFSLSQLLDTWEMSLRQACAPKIVAPTQVSVVLNV